MPMCIAPRKPVPRVGHLIREFVITTKRTYHTGDVVHHVEHGEVKIAAVEKSHVTIRNIAHGRVPIDIVNRACAIWVDPNDFVEAHKRK